MKEKIKIERGWRMWWQLTRPHTLTAAFAPVFLGTMLALPFGKLDFLLFAAMLFASVFIQMATNMFNEYYDFKRGLDTEDSVGIGGTIVRNKVNPRTILNLALLLYGVSVLLGIYICMQTSWWLAGIGAVSMAIGYFYTGGPYPIAYTPFGELFSGVVMGMLLVLIAFYIQTGTVTERAVLLSIPSVLLVAAIMMANNIRDLEGDKAGGRKTLAILLGKQNAIRIQSGFFLLSFGWILGLVAFGGLTPWSLLVILCVKKPIQAIQIFKNFEQPIQMVPAMKYTAQTNTFFCLLLAIGLLIGHLTQA